LEPKGGEDTEGRIERIPYIAGLSKRGSEASLIASPREEFVGEGEKLDWGEATGTGSKALHGI